MTSPQGIGEIIGGRYRLVELLGAGGFGRVWRADDSVLRRQVAVKEVRIFGDLPGEYDRPVLVRALAEARNAAALDHPAIVPVYDVVSDRGRPWIVMKLVTGGSLRALVERSGPAAEPTVAAVALRLLDALEAAHAKGVIHRDLKPENILLDERGNVLLTDFSIAKMVGADPTAGSTPVGTPGYIAPERLAGSADAMEDLFSLGATLYFLVEGRPAFEIDGLDWIAAFTVTLRPHRPPERADALRPVLDGLLAKDPVDRLSISAARGLLATMDPSVATPPFANYGPLASIPSVHAASAASSLSTTQALSPPDLIPPSSPPTAADPAAAALAIPTNAVDPASKSTTSRPQGEPVEEPSGNQPTPDGTDIADSNDLTAEYPGAWPPPSHPDDEPIWVGPEDGLFEQDVVADPEIRTKAIPAPRRRYRRPVAALSTAFIIAVVIGVLEFHGPPGAGTPAATGPSNTVTALPTSTPTSQPSSIQPSRTPSPSPSVSPSVPRPSSTGPSTGSRPSPTPSTPKPPTTPTATRTSAPPPPPASYPFTVPMGGSMKCSSGCWATPQMTTSLKSVTVKARGVVDLHVVFTNHTSDEIDLVFDPPDTLNDKAGHTDQAFSDVGGLGYIPVPGHGSTSYTISFGGLSPASGSKCVFTSDVEQGNVFTIYYSNVSIPCR